jgi:hypothetical protein
MQDWNAFPDTITTHTLDLNVPKNLDQHLLHTHTPLPFYALASYRFLNVRYLFK